MKKVIIASLVLLPVSVFAQEVPPPSVAPQVAPQRMERPIMPPPPEQGGPRPDAYRSDYQQGQGQPPYQGGDQRGEFRQDGRPPMGEGQQQQYGRNLPPPPGGNGNEKRPENFRSEDGRGSQQVQDFRDNEGGQPGYGGEGGEFNDEEQQKKRDEEEFRRMKQQLRGFGNGITNTKKMLTRLASKNVAVPAEYTALIAELETAYNTVKNATEFSDEVQAAMDVIQEKGDELRDIGPKIGMIEQFPKAMKQAEKELAQIKKLLDRAKKKLAKSTVDVSAVLGKVNENIATVESAIAAAKSSASAGDYETALDALRDNVFEAMQDVRGEVNVLENLSNMSRMVKQINKDIAQLEKTIAKLKAKKVDTTTLAELVAALKAKLAEVQANIQSGDVEVMFTDFSEIETLRNDAFEEQDHLMGKKTQIDKQVEGVNPMTAPGGLGGIILDAWRSIW